MMAAQEKTSQQPKTQLFHILAEGKYNPQYWLHFEVSAAESLWSLDAFLKHMWIDDLDHLSSFTINGTEYNIDYPDEMFFFSESAAAEEPEKEISAEEEEQEVRSLVNKIMSGFTRETESMYLLPFGSAPLPVEWVAEIKKPRSVDDLVDFLNAELLRVTNAYKVARKDAYGKTPIGMSAEIVRSNYLAALNKKRIVETLLEEVEDRSMDVSLKRVLKVGQKFSYTYDFGSSTYITLKVIAAREGIAPADSQSVQLLAQNSAPTFSCVVCGKPATHVEMDYVTACADSAYCANCSRKQRDEGMMLPIINSPRVGVL
jgi:hypothetical protein